jgi:transposase-like protein
MKSRILTREELYQLVWSKAATKLALELGISDVAITKLCRRHSIPKPWPGYWRILEAGVKPKIPSLPRLGPMKPTRIEIWPSEPQAKRIEEPLSPDVLESMEKEKREENRILVPNSLEKAHAVIKRAEKLFKKAVPDDYNRLWFSSITMKTP